MILKYAEKSLQNVCLGGSPSSILEVMKVRIFLPSYLSLFNNIYEAYHKFSLFLEIV